MEMTIEEIKRTYSNAGGRRSKSNIIMTLAELNGCSRHEIAMTLTKNGVWIDPAKLKEWERKKDDDVREIMEASLEYEREQQEQERKIRKESGGDSQEEKQDEGQEPEKPEEEEQEPEETKDGEALPYAVFDAIMDQIDRIEKDLNNIKHRQEILSDLQKKKEADYRELCTFMNVNSFG